MVTKKQKANIIKKFIKWLDETGIVLCKDSGEPYEGYYEVNELNNSIIERFLKEKARPKND